MTDGFAYSTKVS